MGFLAGGGEINIARANSEKGKAASDHSNGYSGVWLIFAIIIICLLAVNNLSEQNGWALFVRPGGLAKQAIRPKGVARRRGVVYCVRLTSTL